MRERDCDFKRQPPAGLLRAVKTYKSYLIRGYEASLIQSVLCLIISRRLMERYEFDSVLRLL